MEVGEDSKKGRADKTADPLGMFPLANWISMTDLHFHMGRSEQKGGESRREVVTGKLIFERGHSPIDRATKGRSRNFRVNCPDSREARILIGIVYSFADVTILYRQLRFLSLRRESTSAIGARVVILPSS